MRAYPIRVGEKKGVKGAGVKTKEKKRRKGWKKLEEGRGCIFFWLLGIGIKQGAHLRFSALEIVT